MGQGAVAGGIGGAANGASSGASVGGVPGAIVGGILGGAMGVSSGLQADAAEVARQNEINEYLAQIGAIDLPTYQQRKLELQQYSQGQQYSPEEATALSQGDTQLSKVQENPVLKQAQMQALADFQRRAQGGFNVNDQAALIEAQRATDRANQGQQGAIMQNMAARGMAGGGAEFAARLQAQQAAASQTSDSSLKVAAQARQAAIDAMRDSASLSGNISDRDYSRNSALAKTRDSIAQQNLTNKQNMNTYNVGNRNAAQMQNINRANQVADRNTDISNTQQEYNKKLLMDDYNAKTGRAALIHGIAGPEADRRAGDATNATSGVVGAIGGVGGILKGLTDYKTANKTTADDDIANKKVGEFGSTW